MCPSLQQPGWELVDHLAVGVTGCYNIAVTCSCSQHSRWTHPRLPRALRLGPDRLLPQTAGTSGLARPTHTSRLSTQRSDSPTWNASSARGRERTVRCGTDGAGRRTFVVERWAEPSHLA